MFLFGSGALFATPYGSFIGPNPTPLQFGTLQDASFDISGTMKELYGRNMLPEDVKRAQVKITGKAKYGRINGKILNDLFWGGAYAVGSQTIGVIDEAGTVPAVSTYTLTVTNAASFKEDLGVRYSATGASLTKVTSAPTTGQYSVNTTTGVYTFASTDASAAVLISYTYTAGASVGNKVLITNQAMGHEPAFSLVLTNRNDTTGQVMTVKFFACRCSKLSMGVKNEDYTIPDFDFTAFADASGNVMEQSFGE